MRFFGFLLVLFGFVVVWLVLFKPFSYKIVSNSANNAIFKEFVYRAYTTHKAPLLLQGKRGVQRKDRILVDHPIAIREDESLEAKWGRYDKKSIFLRGNVRYTSKDFRVFAPKALYNIVSEQLMINAPYTIIATNYTIKGQKLLYNKKLGTIRSDNIKAKFKE